MPFTWAAARPSATGTAMAIASRHDSVPLWSRARSVCPSSSSITANGVSSTTPSSWIAMMLGCDRAATARASVSNRWRMAGSAAMCGAMTLMATSRPRRVSRARYTSPMPPAPSDAVTSY